MTEKTRVTLKLSRDRPCAICGKQDGTTVPCHYTGFRQHAYGKCMSQKCNDLFTADLCGEDHARVDQPREWKSEEASREFQAAILVSLHRDYKEGRMIFKDELTEEAEKVLFVSGIYFSEEAQHSILMSLYKDLQEGRLFFK